MREYLFTPARKEDYMFKFEIQKGLYYFGEFIVDFEPKVIKTIIETELKTGNSKRKYIVQVIDCDGCDMGCKEIENLSKISFFDQWGVPDGLLNKKSKEILTFKLQTEAKKSVKEYIYTVVPGFYELDDGPIFVLGDSVIGNPSIRLHVTGLSIKKTNLSKFCYDPSTIKKYISLIPGVTEILFYSSLLAIVKPILKSMGIKVDFVTAIIGPSGHLKTSIVRKYALWLENNQEQEISFSDGSRRPDILKRIDYLEGLNFLADDLHKVAGSQENQRQSNRLDTIVRHLNEKTDCANVMVTGESVDELGIFSSRDRILQITVPRMTDIELGEIKNKFGGLSSDYMAEFAMYFAKKLMDNYDELIDKIPPILEEIEKKQRVNSNSVRIYNHARFIYLVEILVRKYCFGNDVEISGKNALDNAIAKSVAIQQKQLMVLRKQDEPRDIVCDVLNMLNDSQCITAIIDKTEYCPSLNCYYIHNNTIYITSAALQNGLVKKYKRIYSIKKVSDALHNAGVLEEDVDSRSKKTGGKRHYCINVEMLELYGKLKSEE